MVHDLSVADASDPSSLQSSSLQSSSLEANAPRDYQERHTECAYYFGLSKLVKQASFPMVHDLSVADASDPLRVTAFRHEKSNRNKPRNALCKSIAEKVLAA